MHDSIGKMISCIYWQMQSHLEKKLKVYDIGIGEVPILMLLFHKSSANQREITEELHIDKATTSREIKKLIAKGYVKRRRDERDKRSYIISLTKEGRKVVPAVKKVLREWREHLLKGFSKEEKQFILTALERIVQNALFGG